MEISPRLLATRKYNASPHGKAKRAAYRRSQANAIVQRRYQQSPKGRAAMKRANASPRKKERDHRYYESGKGKAAIHRYQQTAKGRESLLRGVHKRRAHMMVLATLTAAEWEAIKAAHNYACSYCRRTDRPLTRDHVIPLSKGGTHTAGNVIPACRSCNSRKGARVISATGGS